MASITAEGSSRRFGDVTAVNTLTIDLPEGGVIGLVGPNGSGKSTAIRMLLGLIRPSSGSGGPDGSIADPSGYAARVGALIENPAFIPTLSARSNLDRWLGWRPAERPGRPSARDRRARRAREGAGEDLLPRHEAAPRHRGRAPSRPGTPHPRRAHEWPRSRRHRRDPRTAARLAGEDRTVIVSSHLLAEIEAACDYIVVIRFGELMFSGPIGDLMSQAPAHMSMCDPSTSTTVPSSSLLQGAGYEVMDLGTDVRIIGEPGAAASANRMAASAGITLASMSLRRRPSSPCSSR